MATEATCRECGEEYPAHYLRDGACIDRMGCADRRDIAADQADAQLADELGIQNGDGS
jgi:hypothetical protein